MKDTEKKPLEAIGYELEPAVHAFFNNKALREPGYKLYRLTGSKRYYFTQDEQMRHQYYVSVTTLISATVPKSYFLEKWIIDQGAENQAEILEEASKYGTLMHMEIERFIIDGVYDLEAQQEAVTNYAKINRMEHLTGEWIDKIQRDLLAFAQFYQDHNIQALAVEVVLKSSEGYAGAIDLMCEMDIEEKGFFGEVYKSGPQKGLPKETKRTKRIKAIIDFKSGRKGFYETHEIQIHMYKRMAEENFGVKIDKVFNWSPKEWTSTPGYNLKDQTESRSEKKINHLLALWKIDNPVQGPSDRLEVFGELHLGQSPKNNFRKQSFEQLINQALKFSDKKEQAYEASNMDEFVSFMNDGLEDL